MKRMAFSVGLVALGLAGCAYDTAQFTCPGGGSGSITTSRIFLTTGASIPVCGQVATITSDPSAAAMSAAADSLAKAAAALSALPVKLVAPGALP